MSLFNKIKAGLRTAVAANRACPGWERDIAMIYWKESDLPKAAEKGLLPNGTLEYATEIIELRIQGERIAKSRYQWAQFQNIECPLPRFPYRGYDSEMTKGKIIHQALLDLVALNKANPQLTIDELNLWLHRKFWYELPNSRAWVYSKYCLEPNKNGPLQQAEEDSRKNDPLPPRLHHYQFAYRALAGLAFADPYVTLGLGNDMPEGSLIKLWDYVGTKVSEKERLFADGLKAFELTWTPGKQVILIVELPRPLRDTEAYFVAVAYPQSWFNDAHKENKTLDLRYFILARTEVPGAGGASGGTLRMLTKNGHGAVKFGVPTDLNGFFKEVESLMRNVPQFITWVDSKPWKFSMQDSETGQTEVPARSIEVPTQVTNPRGKLLIVDDEEGPRMSLCVVFKDEYDLFIAEDGSTAIRLAQKNNIDVALVDNPMADMSGIEVLEKLKLFKPEIEVIMMTGYETDNDIRESFQLGACDYIKKPFDIATIRAAVGKAMQHRIGPHI
jgi:CheY-like chemotaxis protein